MEAKTVFSVVAGFLMAVAYVPYIISIVREKTRPAKASWIIWAILDVITAAGMHVEGVINGQIIVAVIGSWTIVALSLRYGTSGWTNLDKFCLSSAFVGILAWYIFNSPLYGIVISLVVMCIGSIPTFVSAYKNPGYEDRLTWSISFTSCICALIAIPYWTLADSAQPVAFFLVVGIVVCILYIRPLVLIDSERKPT